MKKHLSSSEPSISTLQRENSKLKKENSKLKEKLKKETDDSRFYQSAFKRKVLQLERKITELEMENLGLKSRI